MPEQITHHYLFDRPGRYQIRVVGELEECWIAHLEDLKVSTGPWGKDHTVTQISGSLVDQTALYGLLDLLIDLHMVILSLERLDLDEEIQ